MKDVQLNLFDESNSKCDEGNNQKAVNFLNNTSEPIKCYKSSLEKVEYLSLEDLFEGFDSIKIFTFSYGMKFLNKITERFKHAEIIIGAEFAARRGELLDLVAEFLTNEEVVVNSTKKNSSLLEALKNGNIEIRTPNVELIHKKVYLLKSDDGRVRSILSSANATTRAWEEGFQSEHVEYYDDINMYNELNEEFETSWEDARDILLGEVAISSKRVQDVEDVLKNKVQKAKEVIVLTPPKDEVEKEHYKYILSVKDNRNKIDEILKGEQIKQEKNKIVIVPEKIKKGLNKYKKKIEKRKIIDKDKELPKITIDYEKETALLDGVEIPLTSSKEELKKAVKNFLDVMEFYNSGLFYGDILSRQKAIFKLLNIMFTSPFNAKVRHEAFLSGASVVNIPFFVTITSPPDGGKTFATELFLKMMTGQDLIGLKPVSKGVFASHVYREDDTVPIFFDEVKSGDNYRYYVEVMKWLYNDETQMMDKQPLIIMASNDNLSVKDEARKRSVFLNIDGTKSEKASASTLESIGKKYKKEANTVLFNEFLRRMIPLVKELIEEINEGKYDTPDGRLGVDYDREDVIAPTLIDKSSQVIMEIVKDCGFETPDYMSVLDWDKDIDGRGAAVVNLVVRDIENLYRKAPNSFTINEQAIEILLEKDPKIWRDILPQEAGFTAIKRKGDDCFTATIDRKWIADHSGVFSKSQKAGLFKKLFKWR
jgi:hypothetical protein